MEDVERLARRSVTLAEYHLLNSVGWYQVLTTAASLIHDTQGTVEGDPRGNFSESEYHSALLACVSKGWLRILTDEDCRHEEARVRRHGSEPLCGCDVYRPGLVELTHAGHALLFAIHAELHPDLGLPRSGRREPAPGVTEVFGETETAAAELLQEIIAQSELYLGAGVRLDRVEPPTPCAAWWPTRFVRLPHGFRAVVRYTV